MCLFSKVSSCFVLLLHGGASICADDDLFVDNSNIRTRNRDVRGELVSFTAITVALHTLTQAPTNYAASMPTIASRARQADRILDLGFAKAMDAIVRAMPRERQTLLFSATQTTSVAELARLSLRNPMMVSTTPASESATPDQLVQA